MPFSMPAGILPALDVNREAVKTLVLAIGVRKAARQMGLNEDTVSAWSARGKWLQAPKKPPSMLQTSNASKSPSEALASHIQTNSGKTRFQLSRAALAGAKHMAKQKGSEIATVPGTVALRNLTAAAAQIGDWDAGTGTAGTLTLNVLTDHAAVQIKATQAQN